MTMIIVILTKIKIAIGYNKNINNNYILRTDSTIRDLVRNVCTNGLVKRLQIIC